MIRFLLLNAFIAVYSILFCLWGIALSLFDAKGARVHRCCAVPWARGILWVCGVKVLVSGKENLAPPAPRIYVSNHQSYFDIFVLLAYLPVHFKFVLKEELMRIPLLGTAMRKARYIGIDRQDPRNALKSMAEAAGRIRDGASIVIFPEGTRSPDGELQPFKPGVFHLALKARCDILPLAILKSRFIVPKGSLRIQKGTVEMRIGHPLPLKGYSKKNMPLLMDRVWKAMSGLMKPEEAQ